MLDEVQHLQVHGRGEVAPRQLGLPRREAHLANVVEGFDQLLAPASLVVHLAHLGDHVGLGDLALQRVQDRRRPPVERLPLRELRLLHARAALAQPEEALPVLGSLQVRLDGGEHAESRHRIGPALFDDIELA